MRRKLLPLLLLSVAGCSGSGPQADLQSIKQARSLGAEWALVNEQANRGQLTAPYVHSMHKWLRHQLEINAQSLTEPDSDYGDEIAALLAEVDDSAPDEIRTSADRLKQIEDKLESA